LSHPTIFLTTLENSCVKGSGDRFFAENAHGYVLHAAMPIEEFDELCGGT
jgi:hypothetical protein